MSLQDWAKAGWLKQHTPTRQQLTVVIHYFRRGKSLSRRE